MEVILGVLYGIGILLIGIAATVYWAEGGSKTVALWFMIAGVVWIVLTAGFQAQRAINESNTEHGATEAEIRRLRANITMDFGAVILNSPSEGLVTSWIRVKNSGATSAYNLKGWQKFSLRPTADLPFNDVGEAENDLILGRDKTVNLSSTLKMTPELLQAIKEEKFSAFVWGRIDYDDEFKQPRYLSFKSMMNGPIETIIVDGARAEGWGLKAIKGGFISK